MKFEDVKKVVVASAVTSATLLIIVAGASVFGEFLTFERIPDQVANAVVANIQSPWVFLLAVNLLLLVVGMFMDIISATLILTPIFLPLLHKFGIDTMHFGLLMTINLGIGYCTPPLGVSLYISGAVADRDLLYVTRAVMPTLLIQIGAFCSSSPTGPTWCCGCRAWSTRDVNRRLPQTRSEAMDPKILVPVDGSTTATRTLERIIELQERFPRTLTLLHVVDVDRLSYRMIPDFQMEMIRDNARKAGAELLESRVRLLETAGFTVVRRLEIGAPRELIVRVTNDEGFQLVVIGRRESTGEIRDVLFGSVANFVLHKAKCPVLLF